MGFCEFQAVKFSRGREIHRCTRKRQGCTRNRHTSGRGSPPDRSIRLCACGTLRTVDLYNERFKVHLTPKYFFRSNKSLHLFESNHCSHHSNKRPLERD